MNNRFVDKYYLALTANWLRNMQRIAVGELPGDPLHYERVAFSYLRKAAEYGEVSPTEPFYLDYNQSYLIRSTLRVDGQESFLACGERGLVIGMLPAFDLYVIERLDWGTEFFVERSRLVAVGALLPELPRK